MIVQSRRRAFAVFAVVLTLAFGKFLAALFVNVVGSDIHSYVVLIPLVSAYLIYLRRNDLRVGTPSPLLSLIPLAIALLVLGVSWQRGGGGVSLSQHDRLVILTLSYYCFLLSGLLFFLGGEWVRSAAFPLGFLIFMIPLPDRVVDSLETASRLASTEAASLFFDITRTPVLRYGEVFELPGIVIRVAQECSGIRSSLVLFITSLLAANLFLNSPWRRLALVAVVIPLAILRNGFRILVIASLCIHFGPQMIHSVIHKRGGPLFFILSLIPLFLILALLRRSDAARGAARPKNCRTEHILS
jgi:exosortase C (VPDSG-CTERM-specific)